MRNTNIGTSWSAEERVRSVEKCGEELLDNMLNATAEIRTSNRRQSARFEEALNTSSTLLRPSVLDRSVNQITAKQKKIVLTLRTLSQQRTIRCRP